MGEHPQTSQVFLIWRSVARSAYRLARCPGALGARTDTFLRLSVLLPWARVMTQVGSPPPHNVGPVLWVYGMRFWDGVSFPFLLVCVFTQR